MNQVCVSTGTEACKLCRDVTQGCEQFNNDLSKCEGNEEIARTSIGYNEVGGTCPSISYKCTVNGNSCKAVKMDDYSKCSNPRFIGCSILNCVASVSSPTECKEGYRTIEITYTQVGVSGGANCPTCKPKETKNIPCGRNVASLPFMGVLQIIGAIVIIGVIYYFVFLRNKRRKKVKSKK
ncbi:hypothetical protein HYW75_01490 [Candidatus Pacearchaeota archaeon]|nr:hypothetical protein [Candidatus Pacearchaeota archaeon]